MKKVIKIDGMGCEHCVKSVKETLANFPEIKVLDVVVGAATIDVEENYNFDKLKEAIDDAGYDVVGID